jgi:hypothetical protein
LIERFLPLIRERCDVVLLTPGNRNQRLYPDPEWTLAWFVPAGTGMNPWGFTCWQPILAFGKDPFLTNRKGSRPDAFVMTESAENSLGHPCPKPVGVWCRLLERGSLNAGDLVLDPFAGSGTTLIAAEKTGRRCAAVELAPEYVDVSVIRWSKFTGRAAVLADDGRTRIDDGDVRLLTRTGLDWTRKYPPIAAALKKLPVGNAYFDGELCGVRADGTTSFSMIQAASDSGNADALVFFLFDLLFLNGENLTGLPLLERKARLAIVMRSVRTPLQYSPVQRSPSRTRPNLLRRGVQTRPGRDCLQTRRSAVRSG